MDIASFFQEDTENQCIRFTGQSCKCFIPVAYENKGYLSIAERVTTIGVFTMLINEHITCGLQLLGMIQVEPSNISKETKDGNDYYVCELKSGDCLIANTHLLENDKVGYLNWLIYIANGHPLDYADYDTMATLFDDVKEFTGKDLGANHAVYEVILAHLSRDPNDIMTLWRHTNMNPKVKPQRLSLRSIDVATTSTHSRLVGAYFNDASNSALLNKDPDGDPTSLENLFRA